MKALVSLTISLNRSSLHCREGSEKVAKRTSDEQYLCGVHLVDGNDELTDTKGEGKESVLSGLAILGDTGFEFTSTTRNDEDGTVSLRRSGDHVLDEVTVTGGIDDLKWQISV
jgi:hypothetical protein